MKLLCLNTWGGRMGNKLIDFIKLYKNDVDIFLFQEVFKGGNVKQQGNLTNIKDPDPKLYEHLSELLHGYQDFFCPVFEDSYGIAIFIKKGMKIIKNGEITLFDNPTFPTTDEDTDHTRKMQWVEIDEKGKRYLIMNVHGIWSPSGKDDSPERLLQSQHIISFFNQFNIPKILCGDFNLRPETKSIALLGGKLINLIKKYNIPTTRTPLYTRNEKFADYAFVSQDIKIDSFKTVMQEASDHVALELVIVE